jgi:hypothetical protein
VTSGNPNQSSPPVSGTDCDQDDSAPFCVCDSSPNAMVAGMFNVGNCNGDTPSCFDASPWLMCGGSGAIDHVTYEFGSPIPCANAPCGNCDCQI